MILLDGQSLAAGILSSLTVKSGTILGIVLIGNDPASLKYVSLKQQKAKSIGLNCQLHHLPISSAPQQVLSLLTMLNTDPTITGILVQLPLPQQLDKYHILNIINPQKDVDGLNPDSGVTPAVVVGIIKLLDHYHLNFSEKKVVVVNDSFLIGQPLKNYFPKAVLCNNQTNNLSAITNGADLLISATGVKNIISADMVKTGAVVIDVAGGDVNFPEVAPKCSYITPTFGGIGPMTIASLLEKLVTISHENPTF